MTGRRIKALSFSENLLNFHFVFQIYYHLSHGDGRAILRLIESTLDIRMDAMVEWLHYSVEVSNLQYNNQSNIALMETLIIIYTECAE